MSGSSSRNPPAKAVEIYGHVLGAEHVWLSRIHGEPATVAVWPSPSLDECVKLARENVSAFDKVVAGRYAKERLTQEKNPCTPYGMIPITAIS